MTEFYTDLLKAQKAIEGVEKDGTNPFFHSDYTSLNATILACKETLNANNIIVLQPIESDENGVYVATTLIHTTGERLTSKMRITAVKSNDPQAQGSAITYARRYALKAMLCMSDSDDDGEKAMEGTERTKKSETKGYSNNATEKQRKFITDLMRDKGVDIKTVQKEFDLKENEKMSYEAASKAIEWLKNI
jgi:hypothetical protein